MEKTIRSLSEIRTAVWHKCQPGLFEVKPRFSKTMANRNLSHKKNGYIKWIS